jgi:hypothetical protein
MPNPVMKINRSAASLHAAVRYRMTCDIRATPEPSPLRREMRSGLRFSLHRRGLRLNLLHLLSPALNDFDPPRLFKRVVEIQTDFGASQHHGEVLEPGSSSCVGRATRRRFR